MKFLTFIICMLFWSVTVFAADKSYTILIRNWPDDVSKKIRTIAPEIDAKNLDLEEINKILKKLDDNLNFDDLRVVKINGSNELLLDGRISPEVNQIVFENLTDLNENEALGLMGLTPSKILDEDNLNSGVEKLASYYRDQGYRSANVTFKVISDSTITKSVYFNVDKKEKTRLTEIKIEGLEDLKIKKKIEQYLRKNFRRETLNQDTLTKVAAELRNQLSFFGYYQTQVPPHQVLFSADELSARILYKLKPAPRYEIEITNSSAFEHTYLEDEILKLDSYYAKDGNMAPELIEKIKTYYISEGYPHIQVSPNELKNDNKIKITLELQEGPYTQISDFKIIGQYSRKEKFYKDKFYELSSAKVQDKVFIKEDIEIAAKNLLIYLQNDGYVNAKISRVFISTDKENPQNGLLVLQLEEGQQVKIASVEFVGVSEKNKVDVMSAADLHIDQSLSLIQLENSLANIKKYYQNTGYIEYSLLNEQTDLITYSENNSLAKVKLNIAEGPRVQVQSIVTEGNTRSNDKLIKIELDFKEGDYLAPDKIEESVSRLQRTGHFNSIEINTLEKDTPIENRTVVVKVVERDPGLKLLGVGLTDENNGTLHGYAGVAYRNFLGWGVGLSLRTEANYNFADIRYLEHKHTLGFVFPYLFESRTRFRTSATRSTTIGDIRINKVTEANTAVFSLEQDFTSHITGLMSYSVSTFKDHGITNEDEVTFGYSSESLVIGSVGPTLDFDYRNNLFNPTKGSLTRFSLEYAAEFLGNNNVDDFYRLTAQTTHYFPLNDEGVIFVQSVRGGYIKDIDDRGEGVPFDKRGFTLGGRTTIRGFASYEFFPSTQEIGSSFRLTSSSTYELLKSEIRFPISDKHEITGAIFYDGGQVTIEGISFADTWRDAVGVGFRYNLPVGPLNLEYAIKLDKKTNESDGAFHLSIGVF